MPETIRVVPAHPATAKAWEWLRHGDGMRLTPEKHDRITNLLLDMDELLHELDRETSNQESSHDNR